MTSLPLSRNSSEFVAPPSDGIRAAQFFRLKAGLQTKNQPRFFQSEPKLVLAVGLSSGRTAHCRRHSIRVALAALFAIGLSAVALPPEACAGDYSPTTWDGRTRFSNPPRRTTMRLSLIFPRLRMALPLARPSEPTTVPGPPTAAGCPNMPATGSRATTIPRPSKRGKSPAASAPCSMSRLGSARIATTRCNPASCADCAWGEATAILRGAESSFRPRVPR